jgi:hypothetical protein
VPRHCVQIAGYKHAPVSGCKPQYLDVRHPVGDHAVDATIVERVIASLEAATYRGVEIGVGLKADPQADLRDNSRAR